MLRITSSGTRALCSSSALPSPDSFLDEVNSCLALCDFGDLPPPPPVPPAFRARSPVDRVKQLGSDLGIQLQSIAEDQKIPTNQIVSAFIQSSFDFSTNLRAFRDDPDLSQSLWNYLNFHRPSVSIPTPLCPANDLLYSFFVLSVKLKPSVTQTVMHQWIVALGSNSLSQFANSIICPICQLGRITSGPHGIPKSVLVNGELIFDIGDAFERPISSVIKEVNRHCKFGSEGGCSHAFICGFVGAIHAESAEGFPVEIGGKGATPPYCCRCAEEPAPIAVLTDSEFGFFCKACFESETHRDDAVVVDLTEHFFTPRGFSGIFS
jgi:hypothetical protein